MLSVTRRLIVRSNQSEELQPCQNAFPSFFRYQDRQQELHESNPLTKIRKARMVE